MNQENKTTVFTGERFVPGIDDSHLEMEHYQRYYSVLPLVKDKIVLDAACGEGYGSKILSASAKKVTGIDVCEDAVMRASKTYASQGKVEFSVQNVTKMQIAGQSIDVVVSFETIEHLPEKIQQQFLTEIMRVLKKDGILVMSTPNKEIYSDLFDYQNEFHQKEFYKEEFLDFLKQKFKHVCLYNQYFETVSVVDVSQEWGNQDIVYRKDKEYGRDGKYFIAVAGNAKLPEKNLSHVYMNKFPEYEAHVLRILQLQDEVEQRNRHLKHLDDEIQKDREELEKRNGQIQKDREELEKRNDKIQKSEIIIAQRVQRIKEQEQVIKELEQTIASKSQSLEQMGQDIAAQKRTILNKKGHIEQLLEVEREYERVKRSRTYRFAVRLREIAVFFLPPGSKRRMVIKKIYLCFKKKGA